MLKRVDARTASLHHHVVLRDIFYLKPELLIDFALARWFPRRIRAVVMLTRTRLIEGRKVAHWHNRIGREAVLLIHGNSSCKEVFLGQVQALSRAGFGAVVPDLPGHGRSDDARNPRSTYSFPGYARILARLMSEVGYANYHVVGWSLGGHIGLEMLSGLRSVRSLLITGTPPVSLDPAGVSAGFRWSGTTVLAGKQVFAREDRSRYLDAMMGRRVREGHPLSHSVARTDGRARFWMVRNGLAGVGSDERRTVATSSRPFAIVQGLNDVFVRCDYLRSLRYANIWKDGPVFLAAGHAPHWEIPEAFNDSMMEFLRSVGRTEAT